MGYFASLFYPTWRDACFFIVGDIIGLITMWIFRKRIEDLPKKIKQIEKKTGHPTLALYRPRGIENLPKKILWHGEIHEHSKRVFPPLHPGGRPHETLDKETQELIYKGKSIREAWEIQKDKYIENEINLAENPEKARETFNDFMHCKIVATSVAGCENICSN